MGYYTHFSISIDGYTGEDFEEDFISKELEWGNPFEDDCKWYDHVKDMKKISLKYPDLIFHLKGEGEENIDTWYKHFKNGKMQICRAKVIYDDYDESKLI